jgi:hypothetical protein
LRTDLAAAGRGDAPFEITVSHAAATLDRDEVARYADAGVDRVVVLPWQRGRDAEAALERLADAVLR